MAAAARPFVTWHTARPYDPVTVELLRRAFAKHLRADFAIREPHMTGEGAILIDNDFALRLFTRGCAALIEDTLHEAEKIQSAP